MPRYKLVIEYDGAPYVGWQFQTCGRSVQGEIEAAVSRFCGQTVRIQGAGRTDAGVHAAGQVAHLDLARTWRTDTVRDALNAHLKPRPIAILGVTLVPDTFNARTSAIRRRYRYTILNRRAPPAMDQARVWHVPYRLSLDNLQAGAALLVGRHDFTTFRASECQAASPVRTLDRFSVEQEGDRIIVVAAARSFLHTQVRSMVGTIVGAGAGRRTVEDVGRALEARNRTACGPLAPPDGLVLTGVDYPASAEGRPEAEVDCEIQQEAESRDRDGHGCADAEGDAGGEDLSVEGHGREAERE